jgi:hypothetical protein
MPAAREEILEMISGLRPARTGRDGCGHSPFRYFTIADAAEGHYLHFAIADLLLPRWISRGCAAGLESCFAGHEGRLPVNFEQLR